MTPWQIWRMCQSSLIVTSLSFLNILVPTIPSDLTVTLSLKLFFPFLLLFPRGLWVPLLFSLIILSSSHTVSNAFCCASDSSFTTLWNCHVDTVDKNPSFLLCFWHAQYSTVWFEYEVSPEGSCVEDLTPRWWCYWQECSSNPLMSSYRMGSEEAGLVAERRSLESRIWRRYLVPAPSLPSLSTSWLPQTCPLPPFPQDGFALPLLSKTWNYSATDPSSLKLILSSWYLSY